MAHPARTPPAMRRRHAVCARLLLEDSATPLLANSRGETALHLAAHRSVLRRQAQSLAFGEAQGSLLGQLCATPALLDVAMQWKLKARRRQRRQPRAPPSPPRPS